MKIALVCSHGGHLTELMYLMDAFSGNEFFFITYYSARTKGLADKKYLIENIGSNPLKMLLSFFTIGLILVNERPRVIISTGSEIAIPAFILAKILRIKTIFIESWCRVKTKSGTGRLVYYLSDLFLVQWPDLCKAYGNKTLYVGGIL